MEKAFGNFVQLVDSIDFDLFRTVCRSRHFNEISVGVFSYRKDLGVGLFHGKHIDKLKIEII